MSKSINDLRAVLFATLEGVKDGSIALDKARAINEIGRSLIDTAKVEVDFLNVTNGNASTFIAPDPAPTEKPALSEPGNGIVGIVRHQLRG